MELTFEQKLALIKECRDNGKASNRSLGRKVGLSNSLISRYLNGKLTPRNTNKEKMEYLFELLVDMGKIQLDDESYTEFLEKETEGLYEELKELQSLSRELSLQTVDNDSNINSLFHLVKEYRSEIEGLKEDLGLQQKLSSILILIQFVLAILIAMKL